MFRTSDLYLASALKTILQRNPTVRIDGRLAEFDFPLDPIEAQQVADRYYGDGLSANLRRYVEDLRTLKSLIFQARETQGR